MPKKNVKTLSTLLKESKGLFDNKGAAPKIPSIMEFCESPAYLDLKGMEIELYPIQKLVLRAFYRGTPGNTSPECMNMTEEEKILCVEHGLDGKKNGNLLEKWKSGEIFKELVLVWGRRSGKDFTISIIALYEAMKLLECPGGDPYKIYELGNANPFTILTIANSSGQAKILFREIQMKLMHSPYFKGKYQSDGITAESIELLTPADIARNEKLKSQGMKTLPGSVIVRAGHSNSNTLVGISCYVLLLDEVGAFKQTGGASSGEAIYGNLTPTIKTYVRKEVIRNKKGEVVEVKRHYDGKVISISSPRGMDGIFYQLYDKADQVPHRLMCRLPTWVVNPKHTEEDLKKDEQTMTDEKFRMEYGAEFSGTEGENFFPPELVEACFKGHNCHMKDFGEPGITYFAHLDPAFSSHNYTLAIVHKHPFVNEQTKKYDFFMVLDHLMLWSPKEGQPVNVEEVDNYIIRLNRLFHFGLVTYDQWNSESSIQKLKRAGMPAKKTVFSKQYKIQIYDHLHQLVATGRMKLPFHKTLKNEMLHLQRKFQNNGYRIYPKTEGEVRTDDCCDALAGAVFNALQTDVQRLPMARLAYTGVVPSANSVMWRSMQGTPYGYGSGSQVAPHLRGSFPSRY